jgi:hypothetical protein
MLEALRKSRPAEKFGEDNVRAADLRETAVECSMRLGRGGAEIDQVRALGSC